MRDVFLRSPDAPRSPRIFRKRVQPAKNIGAAEVIALRTVDGAFVGRGFYNPRSQIAVRILDRDEKGPPIDARWFSKRIQTAARWRASLRNVTNSWRLVHAEGDGLSGLVIDKYNDIYVVELFARGMFEHLAEIHEALGNGRMVVRADKRIQEIEHFSVTDRHARPAKTVVTEHGLRYHVDCYGGHKTGFFLDQRDARKDVMDMARGCSVLDLCSYTGGFALAAAKGGAGAVTAVDLDEWAVAQGRANAKLNGLTDVDFVHADAFDYLREGVTADLVVLDPPKLARTPRDLPYGRKKSVDLNRLGLRAVNPGGRLYTFSCTGLFSQEDFVRQVEKAAHGVCDITIEKVVGQPLDHPVSEDCPESRYLTGVLLTVK